MSDDGSDVIPDAAIASSGPSASSPGDDIIPPASLIAPKPKAVPKEKAPFDLDDFAVNQGTGILSSIVGGWKGIGELVKGNGIDAATKAVEDEKKNVYQPDPNSRTADVIKASGSDYNPLNWPGIAAKKAGGLAESAGAPPWLSTTVETGANALPMLFGLRGAAAGEAEATATGGPVAAAEAPPLTASSAPRSSYFEPQDASNAPTFAPQAPVAEKGSALNPAEQAQREAILKRVGVTETRNSAIEGDAQTASNEHQESKLTSPNGARMKGVIDGERQALSDHADSIVQDTGGTPGSATDESTRLERGNNIIAPLDALKTHFDTATKALYDEANTRAAGQRVAFPKFQGVLSDESELTNSDRVHLVNGVNSYLKNLNMAKDPAATSSTIGGDVAQAETVRKYLNENWSPQNSKLVGKLKDALDDDVTQSAGSDVYGQARAMRSLRSRTLDDPNGIAAIMDSSGPGGINRKVPTEKIADTITGMPVAQLNHVIGTLKNLPPELQDSGNAAIAEIKAHMASKVADAGQSTSSLWNAKGVNQVLTKNSAKMNLLFTPEEMAKFGDLNDAGNILKKDQSYPGAAVQEHNLVRAGAMGAIRSATTAAGHGISALTGIPGGSIGGAMLGEKLAGKFSDAQAMKNVESRIRQLN